MTAPNQVALVCEICGAPFTVNAYRASDQRFCGWQCYLKSKSGSGNHQWIGGVIEQEGYLKRRAPDHPRAVNGYVQEHVLIAERALGKPLPDRADVHHVNGNGLDNRHDSECHNLVVCEDDAYHKLLHARTRVVRIGGDPNREKICGRCQHLKPRDAFSPSPSQGDGLDGFCRACRAEAGRARRTARKER